MKTIRMASIAALALGLSGACSQGADSDTFGGLPPGPTPSSAGESGPATFGVDSEGTDTPGGCCLPQSEPGCNDATVESCVCMQSPSCCTSEWTSDCVALVDDLGCGFCVGQPPETSIGDPDGTGLPPGEEGDCCVAGTAPGCTDEVVEECVCTEIPFCCESGWEEVCASAVEALACGHCGGSADTGEPPPGESGEPPPGESGEPPPGDSGGEPPPPAGGCCEIAMTPGCTDPAVQDCVCMQDAFCCDMAWDDICVGEVDSFGCGSCGGMEPPPEVSSCCSEQLGAGCDDPAIQDCVCFIDEYCCNTQWDAACAAFVELFMCGSCS
jgi:hypothetical protein